MINIEIKNDQFTTRTGISKKTGQNYSMREQEAWAFLVQPDGSPQPYPTRIIISLDDNQPPFPRGSYVLDPSSIFVAQFSRLSLGRVKLTPIAQKVSRVA